MALPALAPGPVQVGPKSMGGAYIKVEMDFQSNWNAASPVWTDVTRGIRWANGLSWNLGRNDEFGEIVPGQFTITFNNLDRRFDPAWPGPYNTGGNTLDTARPCRITGYYPDPSTPFVQFWGQVDEWEVFYPNSKDSYVQVTGVDFLGALSYARAISLGSISLTSLARLNEFMGYAGIDSSRYSFINGAYSLLGQTYAITDLLSGCQQVCASQNQVFYCDRKGTLRNTAVFGSTGVISQVMGESSGEAPIATMQRSRGGTYAFTIVIITPSAPTSGTQAPTATAKVSTAVFNRYGYRPYQRNVAAVTSANAQSAATAMAGIIAGLPQNRIKQVTIEPMRAPPLLFPVVLAADFGSQVVIKYLPPGGGPRFVETNIIQSIRHEVTSQNWLTTWETSPSNTGGQPA